MKIKTYLKTDNPDLTMINISRSAMDRYMQSLGVIALLLLFAVNKVSAQCATLNLSCNDLINVSVNEDCYATINADLLLEDPPLETYPDDGLNYDIQLIDENGYLIIPSNQVGEEHVGMTIEARITLVPCNISCWGYIYVEDKIGPKFWNCVDGSLPTVDIDCDDFSNGYMIPDPLLGSVCETIDDLEFVDDTTSLNCVDDFALTISRVWTASDLAGNTTRCAQQINIRKFDLIDLVMPPDYIVTIDPDADCFESQDVSPERTGYPNGIYCPNIMYYYTDINYPQCGIQIKLLRDWYVIDWCTGQTVNDGQIIKIIDETAPRVVCGLDTLMVAKENYNCESSPILNPLRVPGYDTLGAVTVLDTCPEDIFVEVGFLPAVENKIQPLDSPYYIVSPNDDGVYPLPKFQEDAWIRYCFSDACGNETEIPDNAIYADSLGYCCYFFLDGKDLSPPTPVCEGFTKVPLGAGGIAEVPAASFDDNSFDPCDGISHFEVRRESGSCPGYFESGNNGWNESVHFCCEDLGDTITIRLRVFDNSGNFSECLGLVCVSNPVTPDVDCPDPLVELDCGDSYHDYDLIGYPEGVDGCNAGVRVRDERFDISDYDLDCGTGEILRIVEVEDIEGDLIKVCEQLIVYDADAISATLQPGDFEFPEDITIDICDSGGSLDPVVTGIPFSDKEFGCANIAITYEDSPAHTQNSGGVCYTIIREWQVVDWCNYHPSLPNQHVLKSSQEIRVINTAVPEFNCPQDKTFHTSAYECEADVELQVSLSTTCPSNFEVEWEIDANSDGNFEFFGYGAVATGTFPAGEHLIRFTGRNYCGGTSSTCTYRFTVIGDKPPVPICLGELTWSVGTGQSEVWASDFDFKSEGGCGLDELLFSFVDPFDSNFPQEAKIFDCDDIPNGIVSEIPVEIFVIDEDGRFASCQSTLILQDTNDACLDQSNSNTVGGQIHTEMLQPLTQVMVELKDMHNEDLMMEMTDFGGDYAFEGILSENSYQLKPYHNKDHLNGVSTLDLLLMQRHILGIESIQSPYKLIAADVDKSSSVTAIDLVQLRKLILGIYEELPEANSWAFVPESHEFIDPLEPWGFPDYLELSHMSKSDYNANFVAVKLGDINNSATLNSEGAVDRRNNSSVLVSTPDASYTSGELAGVPVIIEEDIAVRGMQFTINFNDDMLLFQGIDGGALTIGQENFALLNSAPGTITLSIDLEDPVQLYTSDVLFTVYFEALADLNIATVIDLTSDVTNAEVYSERFEVYDLDFIITGPMEDNQKNLELFQNEPNPFSSTTVIGFYTPEDQNITLEIMDANGRLLIKREQAFKKGVNKFELDSADLDASGLLLYRINSKNSSITRKMIMVK